MTATASQSLGKSGFVKEFLNDHPRSNPTAVNQAWIDAGMAGQISPSLVNKIRAELGLVGNLRGTSKTKIKTKKKAARTRKVVSARGVSGNGHVSSTGDQLVATAPRVRANGKAARVATPRHDGRHLADVEADIDRLIFKVMNLGNLPKVEASLRDTRRSLYVGK